MGAGVDVGRGWWERVEERGAGLVRGVRGKSSIVALSGHNMTI